MLESVATIGWGRIKGPRRKEAQEQLLERILKDKAYYTCRKMPAIADGLPSLDSPVAPRDPNYLSVSNIAYIRKCFILPTSDNIK